MAYDLKDLRREYVRGGLHLKDLAADPISQFERWMAQAVEAEIPDPTAMTLASVAPDGQPSQRIVLLKGLDRHGFVFYTNLRSRKGRELQANPKVSLHFPWHALERQVSLTGQAKQLDGEEALAYFRRRPRESQLAAWASRQSQPVASREKLMARFEEMQERFSEEDIPLPEFWGGFRVKPQQIEFWQGGAHRLHDRFQYTLEADGNWRIDRLEP